MWTGCYVICVLFLDITRARSHCMSSEANVEADVQPIGMPPYSTTTTAPNSTITTKLTCEAQCVAHYPRISAISWVPEEQIVYTTQITVGTIRVTGYMDSNTIATAIRTGIDYRWSGTDYMYPPYLTVDEYGTAFAVSIFTNTGTTTVLHLAYPNSYIDYAAKHSWKGILPTQNEAGSVSCASMTAKASTEYLTEHHMHPQPTAARRNGSFPSGKRFQPLWVPIDASTSETFFRVAFPSVSAFAHCSPITTTSPTPTIFYVPRFAWEFTTVIKFYTSIIAYNESSVTGWNRTTKAVNSSSTGGLHKDPIVTLVVAEGGTTTQSGDGPHWETFNRSFALNDADRVWFQVSRARWNEPTDSPDRGSPYFLRTESDWIKPTRLRSTGQAYYLRTRSGWDGTVVVPQPTHWLSEDRPTVRVEETAKGWLGKLVEPQSSPVFRSPDAVEAAVIASYFNGHPEFRVKPPFQSQQTQHLDKLRPDLKSSDQGVISSRLRIYSGYSIPSVEDVQRAGTTIHAQTLPHKHVPTADNEPVVDIAAYVLPEPITTKTTRSGLPGLVNGRPSSPAAPELLFTHVRTTMNDVPTTVPVYIIPTFSTATIGQEITVNGNLVTFTVPDLLPTYVLTTISNVATYTLAYIFSGSITASIGQMITMAEKPSVLTAPDAIFVQIPTVINDITTTTPAYIINGTSTAPLGQKVTLNGTPTLLTPPSLSPRYISTTINGVATSVLAYILSSSATATMGQTVTVDGTATVLAVPEILFTSVLTEIDGVETLAPVFLISGSVTAGLGQTVSLDGETTVLAEPTVAGEGGLQGTRGVEGGGAGKWGVEGSAVVVGVLGVLLLWL